MPKDATKNIDRYKIKGGQLNEFDFHKNQEEFAEASKPEGNLIPGTPPEQREGALPAPSEPAKKASRRAASTKSTKTTAKAAAKKAAKPAKTRTSKASAKKSTKTTKTAKASKSAKASKTKSKPRGATAKKLAARKAAKK